MSNLINIITMKNQLAQIELCLSQKYSRKSCIEKELQNAKQIIESGQTYFLKRAQWGGKFGNYYHLITLNSKGEYQFVEGFNPSKNLN